MKKILILFYLILLLCYAPFHFGQSVNIKADKYKALIGQKIIIDINVALPINAVLRWPLIQNDTIYKNLEILSTSKIDTLINAEESYMQLSKKIELISFETGMHRFPSYTFVIEQPRASTPTIITSDELMIDIKTVQVDTTAQIKDIKEIMSAPISLEEILPWVGLAFLVFLIVGLILLWYLKTRPKPLELQKPEITISPSEKLLASLEEIKKQQIFKSGQVKLYYSSIVDTLRIYIEEEWKIRALELTSDEIISLLIKSENFSQSLSLIRQLFTRADLVKFAKFSPGEYEHLQSMEWAEQIAQQLIEQKNQLNNDQNKEGDRHV